LPIHRSRLGMYLTEAKLFDRACEIFETFIADFGVEVFQTPSLRDIHICYLECGKRDRLMEIYNSRIEKLNCSHSMNHLAVCLYKEGERVKSVDLLEKSAKSGYYIAVCNLGQHFFDTPKKAIYWLNKA